MARMQRAGREPRAGVAHRAYGAAIILVAAVLALPAALADFPPLHDYPNHVARAFLLAHLDQMPELQRHYLVAWRPLPNLGFDVIAGSLCRLLDAHLVGRLFLAFLPAWFLLGADRLARALHGRASLAVPAAGFFFYNTITLYGFLSYGFGLGLFLLVFSVWLVDRRGPTGFRLIVLSGGALTCYLAHATAWLFLVVAVAASLARAPDRGSWRSWARHAGFLAAPLLLVAVNLATLGRAAVAEPLVWGTAFGKVVGVASLVALYHPAWDAVMAVGFLGAIAAALLVARRRGLTVDGGALLIAGVFALLFLIVPSEIAGTWAADRRLLLPAVTMALLAVRWEVGGRVGRGLAAILLLLVIGRGAEVALAWRGLSRDLAARVALLQAVPAGARLYGFALVDRTNKWTWPSQLGLVHLHDYAVVDRGAVVNGLFARAHQQPLQARDVDPEPVLTPALDIEPAAVDWPHIFARADYLFVSRSIPAYRDYLRQRCDTVAEQADAGLYRGCRVEAQRR
jgi:hypothetical protein